MNVKQEELNYTDYKLISVKSHDFKYNVMKFNSNNEIDPSTFSQPVKLNRKDPNYKLRPIPIIDESTNKVKLDEQNRPLLKDPQSGEIITHYNDSKSKRIFKKKTKQVFIADEKALQLRKSERLPWLLEDAKGLEKWHGSLEGKPDDQSYVMFIFNQNKGTDFNVRPLNRMYKFNHEPNYDTLTMEEADEAFNKGIDQTNVWFMRNRQQQPRYNRVQEGLQAKLNDQLRQQQESKPNKRMQVDRGAAKEETFDGLFDEMEFDEEFQDDDEHVIQDNQDEDEFKELQEKIKKEMHGANIGHVEQTTNLNDFDEDVKPFKQSNSEKEMKKFLRRFDKNNSEAYGSEESDDDDDSDDERRKEEQENEQKKKEERGETERESSVNVKTEREQSPASLAAQTVARRATSPYSRPSSHLPSRSSSPNSSASIKRPRSDSDDKVTSDNKKVRVKMESPEPSSVSATPPPSANDGQLLQESDIITFLRGKAITTNDLIKHFKRRFKAEPRNREIIGGILKKVASRTVDGKLQLREGL